MYYMKILMTVIVFILLLSSVSFTQTPEQKLYFSGHFYDATLKINHIGCVIEPWYDGIAESGSQELARRYVREGKCVVFTEGVEIHWMRWTGNKVVIRLSSDPTRYIFTTKKALNP